MAGQDTPHRRIRTPHGDRLCRILLFGGIQMPYLPAWLQARRARPEEDRHRAGGAYAHSHRCRAARRCGDTRCGRICRHGICWRLHAILAAYAAISVLSSPVLPLPDADGLRELEVPGVAYGEVRL